MKHIISSNHPDVVMIYQDRDSVESAIEQIMSLELNFKTYKFDTNTLHDIVEMKPKVVLLSSNNVKNTIEFYIDYLEEYGQNIAPHSAILLINNRETACAYLACENGLFDNYAIINPLNEPFRLKLVLLHELKIIESHKNNSIERLIEDGEEQLASCIEHGVALKRSFQHEVQKCENNIVEASNKLEDAEKAKAALQNIAGISLNEMNDNVSQSIDSILEQLIELKINNQSLKQNIESYHAPKRKSALGINQQALTDEHSKSASYKILIAEPSDLFSRVIEEIFAETVFKYLLVNQGREAISQIEAFKPNVVLLAYDLPDVSGLDVTRHLRKTENNVPVIAYTHERDKSVLKQWIPLGLSGYLVKPSKKSAILKSVAKAVKEPAYIIPKQPDPESGDIRWVPEFTVGNHEIDEQHKMLFSMINEFFHQDGKSAALALFQSLSAYIDLHFDCEENLLRQINYPNTTEHAKKHDELRKKFLLIQEKLEDYDVDIHHKIGIFLYNWLAKHILKADMEFREYALSIEESSFVI